jgi:thioesterase-3
MIHTTEIKIRGYHLDLYGHVNHARYLEFLEDARWGMMESGGSLDWFMQQGYALVVSRVDIRYLRPATMGEELRVETRLEQLQERAVVIVQRVVKAATGKFVAEAEVTVAVLHPDNARALLIAGEIATRLQPLLEN